MPGSRLMLGFGLALALALAGCSLPAADPKAEALARQVYDQVRRGDDSAVMAEMVPAQRTPLLSAQLAQLRTFIPPGEPRSVKQTGWRFNTSVGQGETQAYDYVYDYGDRMVSANVSLFRARSSDPWLVQGFHVNTELTQAPAQTPPATPPPKPAGPRTAPSDS